ncbi:THAP domain-containing protein 7-like [Metopolophium dirhodum]|uniref:THAP domain-containing protein 7-like n=1 Tax=Metopolophium dirhodum TaxID=44670 RepID=UPI0029904B16|nr:THAP domain-containing protein 7-like [Metopolophium dirhodum]
MSCSAVNCTTNRSSHGIHLFRFPAQLERRKICINNTRRAQWQPTESARLCEVHFEENQFERKRIDGWIKLKWDAIPTIFNVPNPPKSTMTKSKSKYKILDPPLNVQPNEIENTTGASMQSLQSIPDDRVLDKIKLKIKLMKICSHCSL